MPAGSFRWEAAAGLPCALRVPMHLRTEDGSDESGQHAVDGVERTSAYQAARPCPGCLGSGTCWVCLADGCPKCERSGRCTYCAPVVPPLPVQRQPAAPAPATRRSRHLVQFYDSDLVLAECVAAFLTPSLLGGAAAVLVSTGHHRRSIERELVWSGVDLTAATAAGRYVALDAAETLERLLEGGHPDPARFRMVVGGIVGGARRAGGSVRIYGEMVALLQAAGDTAGALALEDLWNDLESQHDFELLCGYPKSAFTDAKAPAQVHGVYDRHSHVVSGRAGIAGPLSS